VLCAARRFDSANTPVATLLEADQIYVRFISGNDYRAVKVGEKAEVRWIRFPRRFFEGVGGADQPAKRNFAA